MGGKLNTFVYVDGVAYGPEDDISPEVGERITAPGVWETKPDPVPAPAPAEPPAPLVPPSADPKPGASAAKAAWVDYAAGHGMDRADAEKLTRDQLVEHYQAPAS